MPGIKDMSKSAKDEAVCTLAALILHDAGAEITADKLNEVITASGNSVEKYWPGMFAGLVAKADVASLIKSSTAPGSGSAAPAAGGAAPAAGAKEEKKEKKEEKKEEPAEVVTGGDLFGGGGGGKY